MPYQEPLLATAELPEETELTEEVEVPEDAELPEEATLLEDEMSEFQSAGPLLYTAELLTVGTEEP